MFTLRIAKIVTFVGSLALALAFQLAYTAYACPAGGSGGWC